MFRAVFNVIVLHAIEMWYNNEWITAFKLYFCLEAFMDSSTIVEYIRDICSLDLDAFNDSGRLHFLT